MGSVENVRLRCKETEHWSDPPSASMIVGGRVFPSNKRVMNHETAGKLTHLWSENREARKNNPKDPLVAKHLSFRATLTLPRGLLIRPGFFKLPGVLSCSLPHMVRKGFSFEGLDSVERTFLSQKTSLVFKKNLTETACSCLWVAVVMWFWWIPIQMLPIRESFIGWVVDDCNTYRTAWTIGRQKASYWL